MFNLETRESSTGTYGVMWAKSVVGPRVFSPLINNMDKAVNPYCLYCQAATDTAENTLPACGGWHTQRHSLVFELGYFHPDSLVDPLHHMHRKPLRFLLKKN